MYCLFRITKCTEILHTKKSSAFFVLQLCVCVCHLLSKRIEPGHIHGNPEKYALSRMENKAENSNSKIMRVLWVDFEPTDIMGREACDESHSMCKSRIVRKRRQNIETKRFEVKLVKYATGRHKKKMTRMQTNYRTFVFVQS